MSKTSGILTKTVFFLGVAILAVWTTNRFVRLMDLSLFAKASPEKKFMSAWEGDITRLDRAHALPDGFKNLKNVRLTASSEKLRRAFSQYPLSLNRKKDGRFNLDIFADEIEGGGIVIQYDLVDTKSGNTVWEMGRTFPQSLNRP